MRFGILGLLAALAAGMVTVAGDASSRTYHWPAS
jgi:hypothetical protein